ncbi:hypothetical protein NLJ89_g10101 [Agrocybe chaxingu]|uniref:Manganese/iron superoxide dismutase C-terminal domain-containing protein n=1 Tax=Agrocybe chaxingu TaxID=84603 RepID=A0A9W8MSY1_9AGAR|nr:hypothetical protein NLJ89_g10101 [Agrocybe chaxingu]
MSSVLSQSRKLASRSLHTRKPLPYPIEGGLGKFLPPAALETLVEYQDGLLGRFNEEVRNDPKFERHSTVAQTAIRYSERKERTLAFNYAVLAINNSFFLDRLTPPPPEEAALDTHQDKISDGLAEAIRLNYGDIVRLKSSFSAAALGMFTNGWVWLVTDTGGNLGILPTLGPSTLLIRSRWNLANGRIFREDPDGDVGYWGSGAGVVVTVVDLADPSGKECNLRWERDTRESALERREGDGGAESGRRGLREEVVVSCRT